MSAASGHRILVVDDDANLNEMLSTALEFAGYAVTSVHTGAAGLAACRQDAPDVVVLDVNLPDRSGFEVCKQLRSEAIDTPIIFLTARDQSQDVMRGLELGGDDYVTKPFQLGELSLRIAAVLRRSSRNQTIELRYDQLAIDDDAHLATWGSITLALTPREFTVLRHLLINRERVLTKSQIAEAVWGAAHVGDDNLVETYISRLRAKLGDGASLLQTVRGVGYSLRREASST